MYSSSNIEHAIDPVFDKNSKVLILGTMPSPKSRDEGFYYGHPQNRFWDVISKVFDIKIPTGNSEKKTFLLDNRIAMWDVLKQCDIIGAYDESIKNPVANDLSQILHIANIQQIYTTGTKATELYKKLCYPKTGIASIYLPSTSPANRKYYGFDDLVKAYREALKP